MDTMPSTEAKMKMRVIEELRRLAEDYWLGLDSARLRDGDRVVGTLLPLMLAELEAGRKMRNWGLGPTGSGYLTDLHDAYDAARDALDAAGEG